MEEMKDDLHLLPKTDDNVKEKDDSDTENARNEDTVTEEPEDKEVDDEAYYRARVFVLADDNDWRDVATGTFQCIQQVCF